MALGAFLPPLLGVGEYGWWGYTDRGSLDYIPRLAAIAPLWSWLLLGAGVTLILGFGLSREPRRGLVWPLVLLSLLFVLQNAELVVIAGGGWRGGWSFNFLRSDWWVMPSWAAVPLMALVPIAELLTERFHFRRGDRG
jgi:hypothetical protein